MVFANPFFWRVPISGMFFFNIGGLEAKSGGLELTQSMAKLKPFGDSIFNIGKISRLNGFISWSHWLSEKGLGPWFLKVVVVMEG